MSIDYKGKAERLAIELAHRDASVPQIQGMTQDILEVLTAVANEAMAEQKSLVDKIKAACEFELKGYVGDAWDYSSPEATKIEAYRHILGIIDAERVEYLRENAA